MKDREHTVAIREQNGPQIAFINVSCPEYCIFTIGFEFKLYIRVRIFIFILQNKVEEDEMPNL